MVGEGQGKKFLMALAVGGRGTKKFTSVCREYVGLKPVKG